MTQILKFLHENRFFCKGICNLTYIELHQLYPELALDLNSSIEDSLHDAVIYGQLSNFMVSCGINYKYNRAMRKEFFGHIEGMDNRNIMPIMAFRDDTGKVYDVLNKQISSVKIPIVEHYMRTAYHKQSVQRYFELDNTLKCKEFFAKKDIIPVR